MRQLPHEPRSVTPNALDKSLNPPPSTRPIPIVRRARISPRRIKQASVPEQKFVAI